MRVFALILIFAIGFAAETEPKKVKYPYPYGVKSAMEKLRKDNQKALEAYNKAIEKSVATYKKTMDAEMKKAMKGGKLELANMIKHEIDESTKLLDALDQGAKVEPKKASKPLTLAQRLTTHKLVGRGIIMILKDGTYTYNGQTGGRSWKILPDGKSFHLVLAGHRPEVYIVRKQGDDYVATGSRSGTFNFVKK